MEALMNIKTISQRYLCFSNVSLYFFNERRTEYEYSGDFFCNNYTHEIKVLLII